MTDSRLTFMESQMSVGQPAPPTINATVSSATQPMQLLYLRIRRLQQLNRILRLCGMVCLALSIVCFIAGVTLMILDFDGNDDEYIQEDGIIKTRMCVLSVGL